jgi:thioredoxin 1
MMVDTTLFIIALLCVASLSNAFSIGSFGVRSMKSSLQMAVAEVTSIAGLDQIVSTAGNKLVVVDYSTTWCGPCKLVLPKYMELSDKFANVIFLKCIGDASTEASALMKREGVRSVPTFHMWKAGARVEVVNGARIEEVRTDKHFCSH